MKNLSPTPRQRMRTGGRAERGATLLVSMIFLVILSLLVVSAVKVSTLNTKMVGNMQSEKEADAAAMEAIEGVISTDFTQLPANRTITVDVGVKDSGYVVTLPAPTCTGIKAIKLSELDATKADDLPCYASGAGHNTGIVGASGSGNSLCSNSNWDISASAKPSGGGAVGAPTHQGIAVRVAVGAAC